MVDYDGIYKAVKSDKELLYSEDPAAHSLRMRLLKESGARILFKNKRKGPELREAIKKIFGNFYATIERRVKRQEKINDVMGISLEGKLHFLATERAKEKFKMHKGEYPSVGELVPVIERSLSNLPEEAVNAALMAYL